jgi:hypothetical protein
VKTHYKVKGDILRVDGLRIAVLHAKFIVTHNNLWAAIQRTQTKHE